MTLLDEPLPTDAEESEAILLMRAHLRRRIRRSPRSALTEVALLFGIEERDATSLCASFPADGVDPIIWLADDLARSRGGASVVSLPADAAHVEACRRWLLAEKEREDAFREIVAFDLRTLLALAQARDAATTPDRLAYVDAPELPILITGETGTGKELLAAAIHRMWAAAEPRRARQELKTLFVSGMPEALVNDELFGHVRGAFTGATERRSGKLKDADGHSLLIDEVGDLSGEAQVRLLRVLDRGEFSHTGDDATQHVRVRVLAATSKDVDVEVEQGRFRRDLLHRISAIHLRLPPLRERPRLADVVEALLTRGGSSSARPLVAHRAMGALASYPWPGNLRELRHVLDVAIENAGADTITLDDLPAKVRRPYLQRPLEQRAHDIIAEHTAAQPLTPLLAFHRVATIARKLDEEPAPAIKSDYAAALSFLAGIPDDAAEHQAAIARTEQMVAAQTECARLMRLFEIWTSIANGTSDAVARVPVQRQLVETRDAVERSVVHATGCAEHLRLDEDPWWRFSEHIASLPVLRGAPPEQIKIALLWAVQGLLSLDRRVTAGVFDAVRRGEGLRGLFQAMVAALPDENEAAPEVLSLPVRPHARARPLSFWKELAKTPTRKGAIEASGHDGKSIDHYLKRHRITPAWRKTARRGERVSRRTRDAGAIRGTSSARAKSSRGKK